MLEVKYTATQAATLLKTDPKTFRKFMRSEKQGVGQGARYLFSQEEIQNLEPELKEWLSGKRTKKSTSVPAPRSKASRVDDSPLDADPLIVRSSETIAQRQRRKGLICNHMKKTRTGTVTELCREVPEKGKKYCGKHLSRYTQVVYCGEPEDAKCGPDFDTPYCKYHNGDISEEEFADWLQDNPEFA